MEGNKFWFIALILSTSIFGILYSAMTGGAPTFSMFVAKSAGAAIVPALIPLVWLAVQRFELTRASGPLWTWSILLILVAVLNAVSIANTRSLAIVSNSKTLYTVCEVDWCINFPGSPSMRTVEGPLIFIESAMEFNRYEYVTGDSYFRAEFINNSLFSSSNKFEDDYLRSVGHEFAKAEGLIAYEIFVDHDHAGRSLNVRGSKKSGDINFKIWNTLYYSDNGSLVLMTAGLSRDFPSVSTIDFLQSITKSDL